MLIFANPQLLSKARIGEAKRNWQDGRFPTVPGDEAEFIPLPE